MQSPDCGEERGQTPYGGLPLVVLVPIVILVTYWLCDRHPPDLGAVLSRWGRGEILNLLVCAMGVAGTLLLFGRWGVARGWGIGLALCAVTVLFGVAAVGAVLLIGSAALVLGRILLHRVLADTRLAGHPALGLAVGYAMIGGLSQISVHFAINTPGLVILVMTVILACGHRHLRTLVAQAARICRRPCRPSPIDAACLAVPATLAAILLVYGSYPEVHSDALMLALEMAHHIAVTGKWGFNAADHAFAVMPKMAVWLFSAHYLLAGEQGARLFNALMPLLTASLVFTMAARSAGRRVALLICGVLLSAPLTFWLVFVLFDDGVLGLLITAALIVALDSWRRPTPAMLMVVALLLSAAIATKTHGAFAALPIGLILAVRLAQIGSRPDWIKAAVLAALPLLTIGLMPYLYAYAVTGNPVFPFENAIFKAPLYPAENFVDGRWVGQLGPDLLYRLTAHSSHFMEGMDGTFGLQHLALLPGIVLGVLYRRCVQGRIVLAVAVGYLALAVSVTQYARYLYPTFPMVALGAALTYRQIRNKGWAAGFMALLVGVSVLNLVLSRGLNAFYAFQLPAVFDPHWTAPASRVPERWMAQIINAREGQRSRVLYLNDRYYAYPLDGTPLYTSWHVPRIQAGLGQLTNLADIAAWLTAEGVTDIIIDDHPSPFPGFSLLKRQIQQVADFDVAQDGIGLYRLTLPLAVAGTDISLAADTGGRGLGAGWMEPEDWGTWTNAETALWSFRVVDRPPNADIHLSAEVLPSQYSLHDPMVMGVEVNGTKLATQSFPRRQQPQSWSLTIPGHLVGPDNVVHIRLTFEPRPTGLQFRVGFYRYRVGYGE